MRLPRKTTERRQKTRRAPGRTTAGFSGKASPSRNYFDVRSKSKSSRESLISAESVVCSL
jgi:hypothetical protein